MLDLKDIIQQVQNGDSHAFQQIVKEFGSMVRVYLGGHIRDFRDIEELSQEIFVAVYWNLDSYNPDYSFATWLRSISRNKLMSYFRQQYSQKNSVNQLNAEMIENLPSPTLGTHADGHPALNQLTQCIGKQSGNASQLIEARYFNRESVTAIADRLNTTVDSVSSRLYRIRQQLKLCIEGGIAQ
jgi:RNA polymerase sigma factor (sigma-70 family)